MVRNFGRLVLTVWRYSDKLIQILIFAVAISLLGAAILNLMLVISHRPRRHMTMQAINIGEKRTKRSIA